MEQELSMLDNEKIIVQTISPCGNRTLHDVELDELKEFIKSWPTYQVDEYISGPNKFIRLVMDLDQDQLTNSNKIMYECIDKVIRLIK